jgi:predicted glycosyltransferase involved in capsule biosynthesis
MDFLSPLLCSLKSADDKGLLIQLTVVEHDNVARHYNTCLMHGINYVWIQDEGAFNKCLAFNIGVFVTPKSKWIICHDLDCLVQKNFYHGVLDNIEKKETSAVQSFNARRVLYCDHRLTPDLISGKVDVDNLNINSKGIYTVKGEAPGGSITLSRRLFFAVGGYDPELFVGYSPEDRFFWHKISLYTKVGMCDDPVVEVFHLCHPSTVNTNPHLLDMVRIAKEFEALPVESKTSVIEYKFQLISRYA